MVITTDLRKQLIGIAVVLGCLVWASNATNFRYDVREVDVPAARKLIDSGAVIVDVRSRSQYDGRHIPGAIAISLEELRAGIPAALKDIATHRPILVYCNHGVLTGPEATDILNKAGFAGAVNLKSGIEGWMAAGQRVSKT
jgi:rhodanese-related sulfurtransferase